jgi:site-specific recombinase XerD
MAHSTTSADDLRPDRSRPQALPQYLFRRGSTFYFKRKVPKGLENEFPEATSGQVWKSLETTLLHQAEVMLRAEVAHFDMRVARARQAFAAQWAADLREKMARAAPVRTAASPDSSRQTAAAGAARPLKREKNTSAGCTHTMRHLYEAWQVTQTRPRTLGAYKTAVEEFEQLHGPMTADVIGREHARRYRDQLIERELSRGTIVNRVGFLATLFRFGQQELIEDIAGNPFERVTVVTAKRSRPSKERRAFTVDELNQIFSSKLYTGGYRPKGQVLEAGYWAPLLGPFVGARLEEIAQLRLEDDQQVNGTWCFHICDHDEDQNLKTLSSYRRVPVHDVLVRCGFLQFVEQQRKAGHKRLFPALKNKNANKTWSNALGKWWARYLDDIGLSQVSLDYHSFRYCFKQQCSLCGIDPETRDALVGHWVSRSDGGRVYLRTEDRQYPFPRLVAAMKELRYGELKLEHLYVPTAAQPTGA